MQRITYAVWLATLALPSAAQPPADFSGTWKMDFSRSESAHQAVPIGPVTLVIRQSGNELTVHTQRRELKNPSVSNEILTYKLDGTETTNSGAYDVPVRVKAHWEGPKLVLETARNVNDSSITTLQVLSLDAKGQEFVVDKSLTVHHGYQFQGAKNTGAGRDVFVRAKDPAKK